LEANFAFLPGAGLAHPKWEEAHTKKAAIHVRFEVSNAPVPGSVRLEAKESSVVPLLRGASTASGSVAAI
jgi:hypothetical protein